MKKLNIFFLFSTFSSLLFSSCEKVIDVKLNNTDPILVIEGGLSNQIENQFVKISKTIPFTQSNTFNAYSGAEVVIISRSGERVIFKEMEPGIYQSTRVAGRPGNRYTLEVKADGKTYTAVSEMPFPVKLDSLTYKKISFFGEDNTFAVANYTDPATSQNQYRYILKANNKVVEDLVTEDRFNNGNNIADLLFYNLDDLKSTDNFVVDMQGIDRNVYKYLFAIRQINGEGGPPVAPANPVSNFNNGALGIFSAYTSSKIAVTIR